MNEFYILYWRSNPQLKNNGYYSIKVRKFKTDDPSLVLKKVIAEPDKSVYGSYTPVKVIPCKDFNLNTSNTYSKSELKEIGVEI